MMRGTLTTAIQERRVVVLDYHGYTRTVEPHCLGCDKSRKDKLRCYQTSGGSESGEREGWKLLNVDEVRAISPTEKLFSSARPGYKRGDPAMLHIYAQI
ncbi:hypothetical protein I6G66_05900 [Delftia acidovorans]|uniref:Uncharacterized protein n=1 Tax=Delftia acidovorans TaxID=80866 RepID=A0A7T2S5Y5_DELAC|nr:hypothetical protein [Delftia acidovorans]QPS09554.1 hypothetical protein I6G66_05900 [Delftia acidovorans]